MESKFKKGDTVVIKSLGISATVHNLTRAYGTYVYYFQSYIRLDGRLEDELEFKEIYDSPLYKVIYEK